MPFEVVHDGSGRFDPVENCGICRQKTRYWYRPKDVAVCPECAKTRMPTEVPSKSEWVARERQLTGSVPWSLSS
jgi:hypothetical protein